MTTGQGLLGNNMFAYCLNNPITFIDNSGCSPLNQAMLLHCAGGNGPSVIDDQDEEPYGSMPLGNSTIGAMGCGIVATYNALLLMGDYTSFYDVWTYFTSSPLKLAKGGKGGISVFTVASYFTDHGYEIVIAIGEWAINELSAEADACILLYQYSNGKFGTKEYRRGGHFVAYAPYGDGYMGYNVSGGGMADFISPYAYGQEGNRFRPVAIIIYDKAS